MTHIANQRLTIWSPPDQPVVCDRCGATSTYGETSGGSWDFAYDENWELAEVVCPECLGPGAKTRRKPPARTT